MQGKVTILEKFQVSNLWDKQLKHDLAVSVSYQHNPAIQALLKNRRKRPCVWPQKLLGQLTLKIPKEERTGFSLEKDTGKVKSKNRTHSPRQLPFLAAHRMKSLTGAGYMRRRVSRLESWQWKKVPETRLSIGTTPWCSIFLWILLSTRQQCKQTSPLPK